jgi:ribosomal RNA assembly protein
LKITVKGSKPTWKAGKAQTIIFKNRTKTLFRMTEYQYELKIPKARIAVLIGKDGCVKSEIEEETKTKLTVDSKEGDVFVSGEDALGLYSAREVIRAVGRGFNPEIALLLLRPDHIFEVINLSDYAGKSKEDLLRLKGRVIGKGGKARRVMEDLTDCYICVYGKTISIIGPAERVTVVKKAIESLLRGSTHANVYKFLEKKRREFKKKEILEM